MEHTFIAVAWPGREPKAPKTCNIAQSRQHTINGVDYRSCQGCWRCDPSSSHSPLRTTVDVRHFSENSTQDCERTDASGPDCEIRKAAFRHRHGHLCMRGFISKVDIVKAQ